MDTYPYADAKGMARWMKMLDEEYPNFNTVGETWVTEPPYTASWQKDSKLSEENSYLKTVMDFSFFEKLSQAKNEETDAWWNGLNRIYNSFVYDYLYPNPSSVMAFIDNHDTDRFLGNGCDSLMLKQALALLLTVNRIPQIYYGTEILMNGTKEVTDGYVRKDFPGGFPNDTHNAFTKDGRTNAENRCSSGQAGSCIGDRATRSSSKADKRNLFPITASMSSPVNTRDVRHSPSSTVQRSLPR